MKSLIVVWLVLLWAVSCGAQSASVFYGTNPTTPSGGVPFQLIVNVTSGCGLSASADWVTVVGNQISIRYHVTTILPPATTCFSTPPGVNLFAPVAALVAGNYHVALEGTDANGSAMQLIQFDMTVLTPPVQAIEYYRASVDHYFITADPIEINLLDTGYFAGWVRTGATIAVFEPQANITSAYTGAPQPVCRFYGRPEAGLDSHFYSASVAECAAVAQMFPLAWILESSDVFMVTLPDLSGYCGAGEAPIYRIYNDRPDVNHRYTTSAAIRDQMVAAGGIAEGYGPNAVAMCAPAE